MRFPSGSRAPAVRHIIWDWNGTLFDDAEAVTDATNAVFAGFGLPPQTAEAFRATFVRPVWRWYESLLGRPLDDGEWERLDAVYHDSYHRQMLRCGLASDARATLQAWQSAGGSQSLLSMWQHDRLVPTVHHFGIDAYFARVDGMPVGVSGGHKALHMIAHLAAMRMDPADVLVVGDSVDDVEAAIGIGAHAVGYTRGTTGRALLRATGVPVVDTLADALTHA